MMHLPKKIIATLLLLLVAIGTRAASEDLVQTRNIDSGQATLEASYKLKNQYSSWDVLFDRYVKLNTRNTTVTRTQPYVNLDVLLRTFNHLDGEADRQAVSSVYVEWNERWYKLGTITSYIDYWNKNNVRISEQFFKTSNDPNVTRDLGTFFTIMSTEEQRNAQTMPFYYVPSAEMIMQAGGTRTKFRLKIENNPTNYSRRKGYNVSYIVDCYLDYPKPTPITVRYKSMSQVEIEFGSQTLFDVDKCRELSALKNLTSSDFLYSAHVTAPNSSFNEGVSFIKANSKRSKNYDLARYGLNSFWTWYRPQESFSVKAQDNASLVYRNGTYLYEGNTIDCGFTVKWPSEQRTVDMKLQSKTPPYGYVDPTTGKLKLIWTAETTVRSYVLVYRALSPEDSETAEANLEDANWKFLNESFVGFGRTLEIEDKVETYNKRYTYAFLQMPFQGSDGVDFTPYEKDMKKLPKGLIVKTTQVTTTPKMAFDITQDKTVTDKIALKITASKLPVKETKQNFDIFRRTEGEKEWKKLETISITNDGKTPAIYTDNTADGCTVYLYKVSTYAKNSDVNLDNLLESDSVRLSVLERSHVTKLDVSKGDREHSVMVNWTAKQIGKLTTTYYVQRRPVNSNEEYVTIHTAKGTADRYSYEDKGVDAGQYYDYRVEAYTEGCETAPARSFTSGGSPAGAARRAAAEETSLTFSNSEGETGFCMSKGIISGRVSYGTGTSVEDVKIFLTPQEDDQDVKIVSHSQKLNKGGTISWATTAKDMRTLASQEQPFTVQLYVHPEPNQTNQPIVSVPGLTSLQVTTNESTATLTLGSKTFSQTLSATKYSHITLAVNKTTASLTVDGDTAHTETITLPDNAWNDTYADKDEVRLTLGGQQFQGYVRELRLWNRVLSAQEIVTTFDRALSGMETGLSIYWPLDEGLVRHSFDISCTGGVKNQRHPQLEVNVSPDTWVPTDKQLSLYGITNKNGEYTIRGVPFTGTGTNYTIKPEKTLHEFMPATLNGFVSKQSLSLNNNDFRDQSSFEYRGTVSYMNTDIPVDSVTFEIDGSVVMADKKPIMSDANGQFTISVPIGSHAIQAVRSDHVLSRYPETGTIEFTEAGIINFIDSTLVNVAGRINGGADNDTIPLGFHLATNRLGVATMTLCLEKEANNRFNLNANRMPSGKQTPIATSGDNMNSNSYYPADAPTDIVIQTDPKTGEFSAMLPPLRYVIKSIKFPNGAPYNDEQFFKDNLPPIDARTKSVVCVDTLRTDEGKQEYKTQGRLMLTYRREPTIVVGQSGMPANGFGSYEIEDPDDEEKYICLIDTVTAAEAEANPNVQEGDFKGYRFTDRPVFEQGRRYAMKIYAQEQYDYYDNDGTLAKTFKLLPPDGIIHINNYMSAFAIVADSTQTYNGKLYHPGDRLQGNVVDISLPKEGAAVYSWVCGGPCFSGDRTVPLSINLEANKKMTTWEGALPQKDGTLKGIIIGAQMTGTRFLTKGPDKPTFVLRDPGGAGSSATLQNDTIRTDYDMTSSGRDFSEKFVWNLTQGTWIKFSAGSIVAGVATMQTQQVDTRWNIKLGEQFKIANVHEEATTIVTTTSHKVSTPTDAAHVGRLGDTYIGQSTNIYYGEGRYLKFKKKGDGSLELTDSTGMTSTMELGTSYYYSEYHLVKNLIPEWERLRNTTLEHVESWNEVPSPAAINDHRLHYYTIYKKGDSLFGTDNPGKAGDYFWTSEGGKPQNLEKASYVVVVPDDVQNLNDTIAAFNTNIRNWKNIIAQNEDDKVAAIKTGKYKNISFSGGNTITESTTITDNSYDNWGYTSSGALTLGIRIKYKVEINKVGYSTDTEVKGGNSWGHKEYNQTDYKKNISYTIADKNAMAALSISVYDSPKGWGPVFITEGGQTMCPYEGGTKCDYSTTNYGTELDKATMRIEKCDLSVENANISDVPSGEAAIYNLHLYNNSETQTPSTYTLYPHPKNDLRGGQLMLDGKPIPSTGISFFLPYGEVKKTLVLTQGDLSVTDYSYMLRLQSAGDTSRVMSDWKTLTAHFIPTSAKVGLESDLAVINSETDSATITLRNLDRNFQGLKGVRLQYRRKGTDTWTLAQTWINTDYRKEYPTALTIPPTGNITWRMLFAADGTYELRAQTFSLFGNEDVVRESEVITLIQDLKKPQAMSTSNIPSHLTLLNRNDIHVTFDEPIRKAAISQAANVRIVEVTSASQGSAGSGSPASQAHVLDEADYSLTISDNEIYFAFRDAILPKMHGRIYKFSVFEVPDQYGNKSDTISWLMDCNLVSSLFFTTTEDIILQKGESTTVSILVFSIESGHDYTISGQPSWVKLSKTEGTTDVSGGSDYIDMTILPTAPIGVHDFSLWLTESNGIKYSIDFHITIEGNKPDWTCYPDVYENNMVIIGRLKSEDGGWSTDKQLLIGAFDDYGTCRGMAYTDYTVPNSQLSGGIANLIVYGNVTGENITFRVYDEKTGLTYQNVAITLPDGETTTTIKFDPEAILGGYDTPVAFQTGNQLMQNLVLKKGWNWVSFFLDTKGQTIEQLLGEYAYTIGCIKTKDMFSDQYYDDEYGRYRLGGNLANEKIEQGKMYKIYSIYDTQMSLSGTRPAGQWKLTLQHGWNWIGVPYHNVLALEEIFRQPTFEDFVKDRYYSATYNERGEWEGTLKALLPGEGYIYRSMADDEVLVNEARQAKKNSVLSFGDYSDNMTIVMQPLKGDDIMPNTEVSVYIGETLRGRATTNSQGICYLTIAGSLTDAENRMTIKVGDTETIVPLDIWYGNDAIIGNTSAPYVLQLIIPDIASVLTY